MAYSTRIDERYYIGLTSYTAGSLDVNDSFYDSSSVFGQLVQGTFAYGELTYNNGALGLFKDVDIYDLGILSTGYYSIDVDDFTWDFSNFDSGSVSSFSLLNSFGQTLDTKYNTFTNIDFSVTSQGQYYVMISGPVFLDAQYTVKYDRTGDLVTTNPAIFGQATYYGSTEVGNSIRASNTYYDADGNSDSSVGIGWYIDGVFQGLTDSSGSFTLLPEHEGKVLSFRFSFYDDVGNFEISNFYVAGTVTNPNDAPTGTVTITGTVRQSETVTANVSALADADGLGTLSYQWKADGTDISGATSSTYTLTQDEVGKAVTVAVSYTDDGGTSESVLSTATAAIENVNDNPTGAVTITGTPTQGQTLTANNALADADGLGTLSYVWQANGVTIAGATGDTYTLTQAEVGKTITVTASYTDGGSTLESVQSSATSAVQNINDAPTGDIVVTGTVRQSETVTANVSALADADGLGTLSYQWKADGTDIANATASTYTLGEEDVGALITVEVTYIDGEGTTETIASNPTAPVANVNDAPTGEVSIDGIAREDETLEIVSTLADEDGLGTLSYQWLANGSEISGATSSTLTLSQEEVGKAISVEVSYIDGQGTAESVTSGSTEPVSELISSVLIDGIIMTPFDTPVENVDLVLTSNNLAAQFTTSNAAGVFEFTTEPPENALITADKEIDAASDSAIGAFDALQALRLAVGLTKSDGTAEWHDYIAADINQDGRVGADDALNILKFAVGLTDGPSADWVFLDGDADYSDITRSNTDYEEGILLDNILVDTPINMTGILVGDVDGSYVV